MTTPTSKRTPAFQFYPNDFLGSSKPVVSNVPMESYQFARNGTFTVVLKNGQTTKAYEDEAKRRFIEEPANCKLLIVVSKLLTGFDAPSCTYIYLDHELHDHGLFQAICRTNRLDGDDKNYGYIVDFKKLFEDVKREAAQLPNVKFHGPVPYHDIGALFERSRLLVGTSEVEGFPNTYLQAWGHGAPVVAFLDPEDVIARKGLGRAVHSMEEMTAIWTSMGSASPQAAQSAPDG